MVSVFIRRLRLSGFFVIAVFVYVAVLFHIHKGISNFNEDILNPINMGDTIIQTLTNQRGESIEEKLQHASIFNEITNERSETISFESEGSYIKVKKYETSSYKTAAELENINEKSSLIEVSEGIKPNKSVTRVACIIPYLGNYLPQWFDAFALSAEASAPLFDFLIFVTNVPSRETPINVKMITISSASLHERILKLDNHEQSNASFGNLNASIRHLLEHFPYALVEFKPCFGILFADYLESHSHWALADLDMLVGKMHTIITSDILNGYDIYTASFGDSYRLYMRGQLTIHRNHPNINNLWRKCDHLSSIKQRLNKYSENGYKNWIFESAEGCYSAVLLNEFNVSILIAPTQISDAHSGSSADKESLIIGNSLIRCYNSPLNVSNNFFFSKSIDQLSQIRITNNSRNIINNNKLKSDWKILNRLPYNCSYWFHPKYQICVDILSAACSIISGKGLLKYTSDDEYRTSDKNCRIAAITHFQGWKKNYFSFSTHPAPPNIHAQLVTTTGFIPLRLNRFLESKSEISRKRSHHMGRLTLRDVTALRNITWPHTYKERLDTNTLRGHFATSYCVEFTENLHTCVKNILRCHIKIAETAIRLRSLSDLSFSDIEKGYQSPNGYNVSLNESDINDKSYIFPSNLEYISTLATSVNNDTHSTIITDKISSKLKKSKTITVINSNNDDICSFISSITLITG